MKMFTSRITSVTVGLCFLLNSLCFGLDLNQSGIEYNNLDKLATPLRCGDLSGQVLGDISKVEYAHHSIVKMNDDTVPDSASDFDVKSIFLPSGLTFYYNEATTIEAGTLIRCRMSDDTYNRRDYFIVVEPDTNNIIETYTKEEYKGFAESPLFTEAHADLLPKRKSTDRTDINRYSSENEDKIDSITRQQIELGQFAEIKGRAASLEWDTLYPDRIKPEETNYWTADIVDRIQAKANNFLSNLETNFNTVYGTRNIIFIRLPDGMDAIEIEEDGQPVRVKSHISTNAFYVYMSGSDFDKAQAYFESYGSETTAIAGDINIDSFVSSLMRFVIHDFGAACKLPYQNENGSLVNELDTAYGLFSSQELTGAETRTQYNSLLHLNPSNLNDIRGRDYAANADVLREHIESLMRIRRQACDTSKQNLAASQGRFFVIAHAMLKELLADKYDGDIVKLHPLMKADLGQVGIYPESITVLGTQDGVDYGIAFIARVNNEDIMVCTNISKRTDFAVNWETAEGVTTNAISDNRILMTAKLNPELYRATVLNNAQTDLRDMNQRMAALRYTIGLPTTNMAITPATVDSLWIFLKRAQDLHVPLALILSESQIGVDDKAGYFDWNKTQFTELVDELIAKMGVTVPITIERDHGTTPEDVESVLMSGWNSALLDFTAMNGAENSDEHNPVGIYKIYRTNIQTLADKIQEAEEIQNRTGIPRGFEIGITEVGKKPTPASHIFYFLYFLIKELEKRHVTLRPSLAEAQIGTTHGYGAENLAKRDLLRDVAAMMGLFHIGEAAHGTSGTTKETLGLYPTLGVAHAHIFTDFVVAEFRAILEHAPSTFLRYALETLKYEKTGKKFKKSSYGKYAKYNDDANLGVYDLEQEGYVINESFEEGLREYILNGQAAQDVTKLMNDIDTLTPLEADQRRYETPNVTVVWYVLQQARYLLNQDWSKNVRASLRKNQDFLASMEEYVGEQFDKFAELFNNIGVSTDMAQVTDEAFQILDPIEVKNRTPYDIIRTRIDTLTKLSRSENKGVAELAKMDLAALRNIPFVQIHEMAWVADEVGKNIARPVVDQGYTLFTPSELYKANDYADDQRAYKYRFNVHRIEAGSLPAYLEDIRTAIKTGGVTAKNAIVLLPEGVKGNNNLVEVLRQEFPDIRFLPVDISGIRDIRSKTERFQYRKDLYSTMLLSRHAANVELDENPALLSLLTFYVNSHMDMSDIKDRDARAAQVDEYVKALLAGKIEVLLQRLLSFKPIKEFEMPDYEKVSQTLISA